MVRPLKYGEKTSVRSVTIPDSMWEALPEPRSQWVVEAIRQMLVTPLSVDRGDVVAQVGRAPRVTGEGRPSVDPVATRGEVGGSNPSPPLSALDDIPEPLRSEVPPPDCEHPKARQVNIVNGKMCLDCGSRKIRNGDWT